MPCGIITTIAWFCYSSDSPLYCDMYIGNHSLRLTFLSTKRNLPYKRNQSVPRFRHFLPRL